MQLGGDTLGLCPRPRPCRGGHENSADTCSCHPYLSPLKNSASLASDRQPEFSERVPALAGESLLSAKVAFSPLYMHIKPIDSLRSLALAGGGGCSLRSQTIYFLAIPLLVSHTPACLACWRFPIVPVRADLAQQPSESAATLSEH